MQDPAFVLQLFNAKPIQYPHNRKFQSIIKRYILTEQQYDKYDKNLMKEYHV